MAVNTFDAGDMRGPAGATGPQGDPGPAGAAGATGPQGDTGPAGAGIATGGTPGQLLIKTSSTDYATGWADNPIPAGGGVNQVLAKKSASDYDTGWVDQTGGGGGGGWARPAVTNKELITAITENESFAHYNAFGQFDGDVLKYANPYDIDAPVSIISIDRNFMIHFTVNHKIETWWLREKTRELELGDEWTGSGYSAFDYTGIIGTPSDIQKLKDANALLITGPAKTSDIVETLTAVSDLGEYASHKVDKVYFPGLKYAINAVTTQNDLKGGTIHVLKLDHAPALNNPDRTVQNCILVPLDGENLMKGLIHYSAAEDGPLFGNFPGGENFVDGGVYFFTMDASSGDMVIIIEQTIFDGTNWTGDGPWEMTLSTDRLIAQPVFAPNTYSTSDIFKPMSGSEVTFPETAIDLVDVVEYREPVESSFIHYLKKDDISGHDINDSNYIPRLIYDGDTFIYQNISTPTLTAPVRIYSIDKDYFIRFNVDTSIDFCYKDNVERHLMPGGTFQIEGFVAFDYRGIQGEYQDIENCSPLLFVKLNGKLENPKNVFDSVSDAADRASRTVQMKKKENYPTIEGIEVPPTADCVWRINLVADFSTSQFPDAPEDAGLQLYLDNWYAYGHQFHLLVCDNGTFTKEGAYLWKKISAGSVEVSLKANKVPVIEPWKLLRDIGMNANLSGKMVKIRPEDPVDYAGAPNPLRNVFGGTVFGAEGNYLLFLIHYCEAQDSGQEILMHPADGQPTLNDNGIYFLRVDFATSSGNPEYTVLQTLYDGSNWTQATDFDLQWPSDYSLNSIADPNEFTSNIFWLPGSRLGYENQMLDLSDVVFYRRAPDDENLINKLQFGSNVANYNTLVLYKGDALTFANSDYNIEKPVRIYSIDKDFFIRFNVDRTISFSFNDEVVDTLDTAGTAWTAIGTSAMDFNGIVGREQDINELKEKQVLRLTGGPAMATTLDVFTAISDTANRASKTVQIKLAGNYTDINKFTPNMENVVWRINTPTFDMPGATGTPLWIDAWLEHDGTVTRSVLTTTGQWQSTNGGLFRNVSAYREHFELAHLESMGGIHLDVSALAEYLLDKECEVSFYFDERNREDKRFELHIYSGGSGPMDVAIVMIDYVDDDQVILYDSGEALVPDYLFNVPGLRFYGGYDFMGNGMYDAIMRYEPSFFYIIVDLQSMIELYLGNWENIPEPIYEYMVQNGLDDNLVDVIRSAYYLGFRTQGGVTLNNPSQEEIDALGKYCTDEITLDFDINGDMSSGRNISGFIMGPDKSLKIRITSDVNFGANGLNVTNIVGKVEVYNDTNQQATVSGNVTFRRCVMQCVLTTNGKINFNNLVIEDGNGVLGCKGAITTLTLKRGLYTIANVQSIGTLNQERGTVEIANDSPVAITTVAGANSGMVIDNRASHALDTFVRR